MEIDPQNGAVDPFRGEITYTTEEYIDAVKSRIAKAQAELEYWQRELDDFVNLQGLT